MCSGLEQRCLLIAITVILIRKSSPSGNLVATIISIQSIYPSGAE